MSIQRLDKNGNSSTDLGPIFVYDMYGRLKKIGGTGSGGSGTAGPQGNQGPTGSPGPSNGPVGPRGYQGYQGDQGIQGEGAQGAQGDRGLKGDKGDKGSNGNQGAQGYQGEGTQGPEGMRGPIGPQGCQGERGPRGFQGYQGTLGGDGFQGDQGFQGAQGVQGIQGIQGTDGTIGVDGTQGAQGVQGFQGAQGSQGTGVQGAQGVQGFQGTGVQGVQGVQGFQGAQGVQGIQGDQGTKGDQGFQGAQGFQGTGVQGAQGTQGDLGPQGNRGISAGATYYFNQSQSSDVSPYKVLSLTPNGAQQITTINLIGSQQDVQVSSFLTPQLGFPIIPGGVQRFHVHYLKEASNDQIETYIKIQLTDATGIAIGPEIPTGTQLIGWVDDTTPAEALLDLTLPTTGIDPTNRMIAKLFISNNDANAKPVSWYTEGSSYYSFVITSVGVIGNEGAQGNQGDQGPKGDQGASGSSDWTRSGNNIYNNNTGKVSIGAVADLDKAQLSVRGIQNNINGGIAITTAGGTDWRMFASDANAVQNGNGTSAGFHITGADTINSAFWIGGWSACVSNSFQSPTSSALATPMAIRGVTGQTGDFMQIRSDRTVTTGDIMTVKSTGLVTLPTVTNALITADVTNKSVITKEYLTSYTTTQLAGKMNVPSLTANFIPKALTATTIGNSRLVDNGSFITIDNKLSLVYQDIQLNSLKTQSIIGGGYSNQSLTGSDLVIAATSIPNYQTVNSGFRLNTGVTPFCVASSIYSDNVYMAAGTTIYKLNRATGVFGVYASGLTTSNGIWSITESPAGDVYYVASWSKTIYKQTLGAGTFNLYATISTTSSYGVGITVTPDNHIYVCTFGNGGKIFKQTSSTGAFVDLLEPAGDYVSICCDPNNNVYTAVGANNSLGGGNGYIYKQTGSTGAFSQLDTTLAAWTGLTWDRISSSLYANNFSGIYKYSGGTGTGVYQGYNLSAGFVGPIASYRSTILLTWINAAGGSQDVYLWNMNEVGSSDVGGGTLKLYSGTGKGTGASNIELYTGQVLASGTTMQTATLRAKIDNTGLMTLPSVTNALITADATGKAVVTKEYLSIAISGGAITGSGTNNYIPVFNGTSSITDGKLLQTTDGISLGTNGSGTGTGIEYNINASTPRVDFVVNNVYTGQFSASLNSMNFKATNASTNMLFLNGSNGMVERMRIATSGNLLIGTSVDNTTNKLQVNGSGIFTGSSLTGQTILKVIGSGSASTLPIFVVEGSQGELFSVSDSLTGSLFSVNDISGLPVLETFSDNTILMGSYSAPSLNTTVRISAPVGSTDIYSIPIATYTGAFFDYTINDGTNLRAGSIMSIWNGSTIQYTETSTSSIGSTAGLTFNMVVSGSSAILKTTVTSGTWIVKIIVRSI